MIFNDHSKLEGQHAFLSPSQSAWLRYDDEKLVLKYKSIFAQALGTSLHNLAKDLIKNNIKLSKSDKHLVLLHLLKDGIPRSVIDMDYIFYNLMNYVNDAIGFKMTPEQMLVYSTNCFGTADAIAFKNDFLRIHDLKTGVLKASMEQLEVYAALFCLEYNHKPGCIDMELRIYQSDEVLIHKPTADDILPIMDRIVTSDKIITKIKLQEG